MNADQRSIHLTEWQTADPASCPALAGLDLQPDAATRATVNRLNDAGMLHITELRQGLQVETTSYVGRVQLGNLAVTVQPKLPGAPLLRLLRYAYSLRDLRLMATAPFGTEPDTLQDLLIAQLAAETREILARGLHRQYVRQGGDLASPRGRFDVQAVAQRGAYPSPTLPCIVYERHTDNILNRALLAGLRLAAGLSRDSALTTDLVRSAALLAEGVSPIKLDSATMHAVHRAENRLTAAYIPSFTIIELLLNGAGVSLDNPLESLTLRGFLCDMNRFFQALLSRFFAAYLPEHIVEDQHRLHGMFRYDPAHNPRRRQSPTPRPDFVIRRGPRIIAMLDAKYRDIWALPLPSGMLYQLAIYALSQEAAGGATILYPTLDPAAQEAHITIHRPTDGRWQGRVGLRPVRLDLLDTLLSGRSLSPPAQQRACHAFAEALAFGATVPTLEFTAARPGLVVGHVA